jgi:hypothetical protein
VSDRERAVVDGGDAAAEADANADATAFEWVDGDAAPTDADGTDAPDAPTDVGPVLDDPGVPHALSPIPPVGVGGDGSGATGAADDDAGAIGTWEPVDVGRSVDAGTDGRWRRRLRRARLGLGVAALVAGAALVIAPGTLAAFDGLASTGVEAVAGAVGGLAVLQALVAAFRLRHAGDEAADGPAFDPAVDRARARAAPGRGHDGLVDGYRRLDPESRARLRRRVRTVVARSLAADGADRATIERAVAEGTWTDDVRAAAFLGDVPVPWRTRVREWLAAGSAEGVRAERAIEAAWRRRTGAPPGDDDPLLWADAGVEGVAGGRATGGGRDAAATREVGR